MRKLLFLLLLCLIATPASGQFFAPQQKPMLGLQVNRAHQLGDGVAYWLFNEGSGNKVFDLSGNNQTGILVGDVGWVPTKYGTGLDFGGSSDYINCGTGITFSDEMTISVWIKLDTISGDHVIVGEKDSFYLNIFDNDVQFYCYMTGNDIHVYGSTSNDFVVGQWYHIVVVVGIGKGTVYIDTIESAFADTSVSGTITPTANPLCIGVYDIPNTYPFDGLIDHVMIYNRVLSASEVALLHQEPFCMFEPSWNWVLYGGISVPTAGGQVIIIN